ncbi:MAG: M23 family metallopeptidase [Anaerolineales bacterium]|nr:MAG: M23 family metallopeptidase [Anaerolineales bacterium]
MKLTSRRGSGRIALWASAAITLAIILGIVIFNELRPSAARMTRLRQFWSDPEAHRAWTILAGKRCGDAPFLLPTDGFIGFLWGSSFRPGHSHQGIDVFGPSGPDGLGETPVVAAYDGYLTRLPEWRSSLILRIPQDPLQPSRQIWTYYTHLADAEGNSFILETFPPGTQEQFVSAGTLLGYQGNYSADPDNPTGMHLHFSVVKDDGEGRFKNELEIRNTLDPSPYLGIDVNANSVGEAVVVCSTP